MRRIKIHGMKMTVKEIEEKLPPENYETIRQWEDRTGHECCDTVPVWRFLFDKWISMNASLYWDRDKDIVRFPGQMPPIGLPCKYGLPILDNDRNK